MLQPGLSISGVAPFFPLSHHHCGPCTTPLVVFLAFLVKQSLASFSLAVAIAPWSPGLGCWAAESGAELPVGLAARGRLSIWVTFL
jgi:hypothetical protein